VATDLVGRHFSFAGSMPMNWKLLIAGFLCCCCGYALADDAAPIGLAAQYFNGVNFDRLRSSRVETNFDLVRKDKVFPPPGIDWDRWSVRWAGRITATHSETYTFYATADDGCRLWIDGQQVMMTGSAILRKRSPGRPLYRRAGLTRSSSNTSTGRAARRCGWNGRAPAKHAR
jgi:hypothetical protein